MPQITVVNQEGEESSVDAAEGRTLMEVIRDNGFDELLALCGGCCSCATCHVHIDPEFSALLPPMSRDEVLFPHMPAACQTRPRPVAARRRKGTPVPCPS